MKKIYLCLFILLIGSLAVFSQTNSEKVWSEEITFVDGTTLEFTGAIREDKGLIPTVTIFNKTFKGKIFDFGKPNFYLTPKTLTAISRKNKNLASQIRKRIKIGYGIEQDSKKIGLTGFYAKANEESLKNCMKTEKLCQIEGEAVIIQIKFKDKIENIVLVKSIKFSKQTNE